MQAPLKAHVYAESQMGTISCAGVLYFHVCVCFCVWGLCMCVCVWSFVWRLACVCARVCVWLCVCCSRACVDTITFKFNHTCILETRHINSYSALLFLCAVGIGGPLAWQMRLMMVSVCAGYCVCVMPVCVWLSRGCPYMHTRTHICISHTYTHTRKHILCRCWQCTWCKWRRQQRLLTHMHTLVQIHRHTNQHFKRRHWQCSWCKWRGGRGRGWASKGLERVGGCAAGAWK